MYRCTHSPSHLSTILHLLSEVSRLLLHWTLFFTMNLQSLILNPFTSTDFLWVNQKSNLVTLNWLCTPLYVHWGISYCDLKFECLSSLRGLDIFATFIFIRHFWAETTWALINLKIWNICLIINFINEVKEICDKTETVRLHYIDCAFFWFVSMSVMASLQCYQNIRYFKCHVRCIGRASLHILVKRHR